MSDAPGTQPAPVDVYRTTVGVTFWTQTVQQAEAKINAITNVSGTDDDVLSTMEFHPEGPPVTGTPAGQTKPSTEPVAEASK